jgi:uncharacterized protein
MSEEMLPVDVEKLIDFNCNKENRCFNECCRNLNQALTPYDILRLKNSLGISSKLFLRTYTSHHFGPGSGLPVVEFKPNPGTGYECPFVTHKGCSVYNDRPASCRMYPLARAIVKSRETGKVEEYFALIKESHCKGFGQKTSQSIKQWLQGQKVEKHNRENDKLMVLISLKNQIIPGQLEGVQADKFYLALYNLDEFRKQILQNDLLKEINIPLDIQEQIRSDDQVLLNLGIEWVKYILFGIKITFEE